MADEKGVRFLGRDCPAQVLSAEHATGISTWLHWCRTMILMCFPGPWDEDGQKSVMECLERIENTEAFLANPGDREV